jgi:hypothetical protein
VSPLEVSQAASNCALATARLKARPSVGSLCRAGPMTVIDQNQVFSGRVPLGPRRAGRSPGRPRDQTDDRLGKLESTRADSAQTDRDERSL